MDTEILDPLCAISLDVIATALTTGTRCIPALDACPAELLAPGASFVTLEREGRLLGCVGTLEAAQPLAIDVAEHALAAAFDDPRVPPVTRADYAEMSVKVSVLSRSEPLAVESYDELRSTVRPGVDGLTIETGARSEFRARATFLPSVWPKVRDVDEFLAALWTKAGLPPRAWSPRMRASRYSTAETTDLGPRAPLAS